MLSVAQGLDILPGSSTLRYHEKLPAATLYGRLPPLLIFSSQQALTLVRYGTKPFSQTSECFGKLQTLHKLLSDTRTLFSHQPNELALTLKASPHTKNSFKTSDFATSRFRTTRNKMLTTARFQSFTNKLKRSIANCKHRARWTSRHGISSQVVELVKSYDCNEPEFFFHEYGRRVGMVPRSSLKEGKNRQMVEKGTKTPKQAQTKHPSPQAETPPSCSLSSTLGETCETETSGNYWA